MHCNHCNVQPQTSYLNEILEMCERGVHCLHCWQCWQCWQWGSKVRYVTSEVLQLLYSVSLVTIHVVYFNQRTGALDGIWWLNSSSWHFNIFSHNKQKNAKKERKIYKKIKRGIRTRFVFLGSPCMP